MGVNKFYSKILIFNSNGQPWKELQGQVIDGNINLDGNSTVRRSCSLSLISEQELTSNEMLEFMFTECEILLSKDNINYITQGHMLISSLNCDKVDKVGYKISLEGKDKMCKLNGDLGGAFTALSTNLTTTNITDPITGITTEQETDIQTLITQLVHVYGGEPLEKIFIYDLPEYGYEMLTYNSPNPLYLYEKQGYYERVTSNGKEYIVYNKDGNISLIPLENLGDIQYKRFGALLDEDTVPAEVYQTYNGIEVTENLGNAYELDNDNLTVIFPLTYLYSHYSDASLSYEFNMTVHGIHRCYADPGTHDCYLQFDSEAAYNHFCNDLIQNINLEVTYLADAYYDLTEATYNIIRINKGDFAGYREIPLVYTGALIASLGDSVASVLEKIKNMLGIYEYFYDEQGNFIFQKKRYVDNVTESSLNNEIALIRNVTNIADLGVNATINELNTVTDARYSYNLSNIKNDYSIWGETNGTPVHLRIAIAKKPKYYKTYTGDEYAVDVTLYQNSINQKVYDWREILYQMAADYMANNKYLDFKSTIASYNNGRDVQNNGVTGYETYYADILGFWRDMYNPEPPPVYSKITPTGRESNSVYINNYIPLSVTDNTINNVQMKNVYIYNDTAQQLQRYVDTLNYATLFGGLDKLYYYKNKQYYKIIDSVKISANNIYIKNAEDQVVHLYESFSDELKQSLYYTTYKNSSNYKKLINYMSIQQYITLNYSTTKLSNKLFITDDGQSEKIEIYEIWLSLANGDEVCLWQRNDDEDDLAYETVAMLATAVSKYSLSLSYRAKNGDAKHLRYGQNILIEVENILTNAMQVYYLNDNQEYIDIVNYLINEEEVEDSPYYIYNLYLYDKERAMALPIIEFINVDKAEIYLKEALGQHFLLTPVVDKIELPTEFYYKTTDKIAISELDDNIQALYYNTTDGQYKLYLYRNALNIYGNISQINDLNQGLIEFYDKTYNYFLPVNNDCTQCWNKTIFANFNKSHFWIDFLYENDPIVQFSIHNIGLRPKTINQKTATHLTNEGQFDIIYTTDIKHKDEVQYLYSDNATFFNNFIISQRGCACHDLLNDSLSSLYNLINSVSFSIAPEYFLQPGNLIWLNTISNHLFDGFYEISRITFSLAGTGVMKIEARKIQNV